MNVLGMHWTSTSWFFSSLIYRGLAVCAALGLGIASLPIEHTHEEASDPAHSLHVHAHGDHTHGHHDHHSHHHDAHSHSTCEHSSGEESDSVPHVHLLVLDLDLPAELVFDLPRPEPTCFATLPLYRVPADTTDGLRIPGARGPPLGLSSELIQTVPIGETVSLRCFLSLCPTGLGNRFDGCEPG